MTKKLISTLFALLVCVVALGAAYYNAPAGDFDTTGAWYVLVPPLIAILLAVATHRLSISLFSALLAAGIVFGIAHDESIYEVAYTSVSFSFEAVFKVVSDPWSWRVAVFVMLILAMSSVVIVAGGLKGVAQWLERYANSARSTNVITLLLGVIIFIDDYANTMIVGSTMRPFSDRFRVSREKLAFLVDATSAPIAGLAIVSTWIAFEVGLFEKVSVDLQLGMNGYEMFFDAWIYRFYCLFLLAFVVMNIVTQRDFGPMLRAELRSRELGQVIAPGAQPLTSTSYSIDQADSHAKSYARVAVIPLALLLGVFIVGLWLSGGGFEAVLNNVNSLWSLQSWREILARSNNSVVLLTASSIGLLSACLLALYVAKLPTVSLAKAIVGGMRNALMPMGILVLAWALKNGFDGIHLGKFLLAIVGDSISPLWFPAMVFGIASIISFGIGTSWGTMSLLIPIVIPLAFALDGQHYGLVTVICLGAVLDGAIFGDHCSPVSDTTIMSSIASGCDHIDHVKTQFPYSLAIALLALMAGYLPSAFDLPYYSSWILALAGFVAIFTILGQKTKVSTIRKSD